MSLIRQLFHLVELVMSDVIADWSRDDGRVI